MPRYYFDTSALIKRARQEPESSALRQFVKTTAEAGQVLFTSAVATVEVERALRSIASRAGLSSYPLAAASRAALSGLSLVPLSEQLLQMVKWIGPDHLRSLDAIHLASAMIYNADRLVTYDQRLSEAANMLGLTLVAPS